MLKKWPHLYIARVCVEAETPLSIQTGQADLNFDTTLVRDANGLPALPSTTIRGVIRHLHRDEFDEELNNKIFGFAKVQSNDPDDQTSRLQVSWGVIHNSQNKPVQALELIDDSQPFLEELKQQHPIKRERVRLNHLGTANSQTSETNDPTNAKGGKFDITACPKGARFSFEMKYWSEEANDPNWQNLLNLLAHPQFRLGHSTKSGFGALSVQSLYQGHFDLSTKEGAQAWRSLPRELGQTQGLSNAIPDKNDSSCRQYRMSLKAEGFVRIGGGDTPFHQSEDSSDLVMQTETFINWQDKPASFNDRVPVIPASAIKGPIAHRTLFHYNRLEKKFADELSSEEFQLATNRNHYDELIKLLGAAKGDPLLKKSRYKDGKAGQLLINDVYLTEHSATQTMQLWHNRIDRFTGGVIDGALFTEEVLFEPTLSFNITITNPEKISERALLALEATLDDLRNGRLAIGAGGSRGLGSFRATEEGEQ